jgi:hypothetical protein
MLTPSPFSQTARAIINDPSRPSPLVASPSDEGGNHEKAGSAVFSIALAPEIDEKHMGPEDGSSIYKHLRETGRELRRSYHFK